jgi:hypothetical protein
VARTLHSGIASTRGIGKASLGRSARWGRPPCLRTLQRPVVAGNGDVFGQIYQEYLDNRQAVWREYLAQESQGARLACPVRSHVALCPNPSFFEGALYLVGTGNRVCRGPCHKNRKSGPGMLPRSQHSSGARKKWWQATDAYPDVSLIDVVSRRCMLKPCENGVVVRETHPQPVGAINMNVRASPKIPGSEGGGKVTPVQIHCCVWPGNIDEYSLPVGWAILPILCRVFGAKYEDDAVFVRVKCRDATARAIT